MKNSNKSLINYILDFFEYCEKERDFSDKTIENYGRYLNRFISWLKTSNLAHLTPQDLSSDRVDTYKEYLSRQNIKNITQNYYLIALRALLSYLIEKDIPCLISPEKIKLPKIEKRQSKNNLSSVQLEKLLEAPNTSHNIGLRDKLILEILATTGLKVAELASVNKDKIKMDPNAKRAMIEVFDKKGNSRLFYIPNKVVLWLEKYLKTREDDDKALFINYKKRKSEDQSPIRLTVRSIERMVEKYRHSIDFPHPITPELLRNAYIKSILEKEPSELNEIYSHKSLLIKNYSPNLNIKFKKIPLKTTWRIIENNIKKEIYWIKNNIETVSPRYQGQEALITCEDCLFRKIAILIAAGTVKASKLKFAKSPWEEKISVSEENHRHGEKWHRKMMNAVGNYFKAKNYKVALEPILNFGRADLGVFSKTLKSPIYVEIGTTSLYKLLYNLLTMKNSIFLITPAEEYMIEFKT